MCVACGVDWDLAKRVGGDFSVNAPPARRLPAMAWNASARPADIPSLMCACPGTLGSRPR